MKLTKYPVLALTLALLVCSQFCFAENDTKSYSEQLEEAIRKAGRYLTGYKIVSEDIDKGLFPSPYFEKLCSKEVVPFLLDVIKNGPPGLPREEAKTLGPHVARCYAALCLAYSKDSQAYSILTDLLENGAYLDETKMDKLTKEKYDIKQYAALGLGILGDDRAVNLLVASLDDPNPEIRRRCIEALAEIKDMRAIKPILNAAEKYKLNGDALQGCLYIMTKVEPQVIFNKETGTSSLGTFPQLGQFKSGYDMYSEFWRYWFSIGKNWTKQEFEKRNQKYLEAKRSPEEKYAITSARKQIIELGIACIPLMIQKIEKGETDLIPLVSQLTDNSVKNDASAKEVLDWWKTNKDKWTIFKYDN